MGKRFISELEEETGANKRKIYIFIRRKDFYEKFQIKSMADLPNGLRNGSISKVLTDEMYEYLKNKIETETNLRVSDNDVKEVVYLIDLHFGYKMVDQNGNEEQRYKLGHTTKFLHERESNIKVSSPEARAIRYWKMSYNDEQTLLKYVDGNGGRRIGNSEVFNVYDLEKFIGKIDEFYSQVSK